MTVAVLFCDPAGSYADVEGVDLRPESRDARLYAGPHPVVAHPPCQRWCRFAPGIERQYGYKVGDDGGCFESALVSVRRYGGVLEHPAHSLAWARFDLPRPVGYGGWTSSLLDDGASCYVEQERYGHQVRKATWLYAYGVELPELRWGMRPDQSGGAFRWARVRYADDENRPRMSGKLVASTPPEFRDQLLAMARSSVLARSVA